MRRTVKWMGLVAPLGQAGLELARAEYGAVSSELKGSGRALGRVLLFFAVALFVLFWAIGAFAYLLVEVAALWLPRWGAAASVLGLFLFACLLLALLARARLRKIDTPVRTLQRRVGEHREWWEQRVAAIPRESPEAAGPADRGSGVVGDVSNKD